MAEMRASVAIVFPSSLYLRTPAAEIATHTVNHVASPNATQIVGARDWLVNVSAGAAGRFGSLHKSRRIITCWLCRRAVCPPLPPTLPIQTAGIPKDKIGGFRAPFLIFDSEQREVLQKNGAAVGRSIQQLPSQLSCWLGCSCVHA